MLLRRRRVRPPGHRQCPQRGLLPGPRQRRRRPDHLRDGRGAADRPPRHHLAPDRDQRRQSSGRLDIAACYVQDQIELSPQFELVLGLRFEHLVTRVTDRRTIGFPAGQQRDFRVVNDLWSPRAGLIFKPAANASLYASFSRAYLPRGGDQLTSLNLANQSLDPERFTNYEIGAKWDVNPGVQRHGRRLSARPRERDRPDRSQQSGRRHRARRRPALARLRNLAGRQA